MEQLPVYRQDDELTQLEKTTEGLYTRLYCHFDLDPSFVYVLMYRDARGQIKLGIPVYHKGEFVFDRKFPSRQLELMQGKYYILTEAEAALPWPEPVEERQMPQLSEAEFIPVETDEPFERLQDLPNAGYAVQDGVGGILITPCNEDANTENSLL